MMLALFYSVAAMVNRRVEMMFIRRKGLRMEFSVSAGPGSIGGVSPTFDKADGTLQQRVLGATFQHIQSFGMTDR